MTSSASDTTARHDRTIGCIFCRMAVLIPWALVAGCIRSDKHNMPSTQVDIGTVRSTISISQINACCHEDDEHSCDHTDGRNSGTPNNTCCEETFEVNDYREYDAVNALTQGQYHPFYFDNTAFGHPIVGVRIVPANTYTQKNPKSVKMGMIGLNGKFTVEPVWDFVDWPCENRIAVCEGCKRVWQGEHWYITGGKWGYLDYHGKVVIPLMYDHAKGFSNGTAVVLRGEKEVEIDVNNTPTSGGKMFSPRE